MDLRSLWCPAGLRTYLPGILTVFVLAGTLIASAAVVFLPIRFLAFPRRTPGTWAVVMLLYPLLSALPQEVVFRALFFARYGSLFSNPVILIACNGLSFGLAHAVCGNWTAMALSTLGGWLFAYRYHRTGSVFAVSLEHGLWGNFLFTVGLGRYLYSGSIW
jgi:membrane protease YdiL (CAAX protease family)